MKKSIIVLCFLFIFQSFITAQDIRTPITLNFPDTFVGEEIVFGVNIYNDSPVTLHINSITPQFPDNVSGYWGPSTPFDILGPGGSITVQVSFAPNAVGPFTRTYNVNSNDPDEPNVPLTITGNGIAPAPDINLSSYSCEFPTTRYGEHRYWTPTVYNQGQAPLIISNISVTSGSSMFYYDSPQTPFTIAAGGSQEIRIGYNPLEGETHSAVLTIYSNDPDESQVPLNVSGTAIRGAAISPPADINFGNVKVGTSNDQTTTIFNGGDRILTISNITYAQGEFAYIGPTIPFNVNQGQSQAITIRFSPTSEGTKSGQFTIYSNDFLNPTVLFDAAGFGTGDPDIHIPPPNPRNFGDVTVGASSDENIIIYNYGSDTLTIHPVNVSGNSDFSYGGPTTPINIPAGGQSSITIIFSPTSVGEKTATVTVTSNDPDEQQVSIRVTGTGTAVPLPDISVLQSGTIIPNGGVFDFNSQKVNTTNDKSFIIENNGSANLVLSGSPFITITGTNRDQFEIGQQPSSPVTAGNSTSFEIRFAPTSEGEKTAAISIYSNVSDKSPYTINLTGTATVDPPTVIITEPGDGDIVIDLVSIQADAASSEGVQYVKFSIDGTEKCTDSFPPYSCQWDSKEVNNGLHTIKAEVFDNANRTADYSIVVYVDNPPVEKWITVTAPNGGEEWKVDSQQYITWTSSDNVGDVKIEYSTTNGSTWKPVVSSLPNNPKTYPWTIPNEVSSQCLVRVSEMDGDPSDTSNLVFSIVPKDELTLKLKTANYNIGNISSIADEFSLWMDVTDENGDDVLPFEYGVKIVDVNNPQVEYTEMKENPWPKSGEDKRWRTVFRIKYNQGIPWFENGVVQIYDIHNLNIYYTIPSSELLISIYGTEFAMQRHAYQFENGGWNNPKTTYIIWGDEFFKAVEDVGIFLSFVNYWMLWTHVGRDDVDGAGLCYGMTNSAIANFTYGDKTSSWGIGGVTNWFHDIQSRWPFTSNTPNPPHKPYNFTDVYSNASNPNTNSWTIESCKKIVYYHVTQQNFNALFDGWPGEDRVTPASLNQIRYLLKLGNPISLNIYSNDKHSVAITQMINWTNATKLIIYDNNYSVRNSSNLGCFSEIKFTDPGSLSFEDATLDRIFEKSGEVSFSSEKLKDGKILTLEGDSQKIYNHSNSNVSQNSFTYNPPKSINGQASLMDNYARFLVTMNYIDITAVGAESFDVFDNATNEKITLVKNGQLNGSQSVYKHTPGTILTKIYLPANPGKTYRVRMVKNPQIPRLKIFINVPKEDNFLEAIGYDNIHKTKTDQTTVEFLVGKDNADYTLERTSSSNQVDRLNPEFVENYQDTSNISEISLNKTSLHFGAVGSTSPEQSVLIDNKADGTMEWTASPEKSWIICSPTIGTNSGIITVKVNAGGLAAGVYTGKISISAPNATNSPKYINVTMRVYNAGATSTPFGEFATPIDGSTVMSSIPVTGWVLDDIGVEGVRIYREETGKLVPIGDAVFVEGARPDIEQKYPDYPLNYQAGWGYMMLTNFLPNGGNGTFTIHAIATDKEGHQETLGTKVITCDNANAVKPFGAIETPAQGGPASGNRFINWGWVLTPPPNIIPQDGSTIDVWIDGQKIGKPTYNLFRKDIAELFPNYNNSQGAFGNFTINTTNYENGVHTIQWTATDNAGNKDGIGSRYFSILNANNYRSTANRQHLLNRENIRYPDFSSIPVTYSTPVAVITGYSSSNKPEEKIPNEEGVIELKLKELDRLEIHLDVPDSSNYSIGYTLVGNNLGALPIGSTLDSHNNIFYWQPGPGFLGDYKFVFISYSANGEVTARKIKITILPEFSIN